MCVKYNECKKFLTPRLVFGFPKHERYGLTSQIRRSGVSIASNIAEGAGRNTNGEFIHFSGIANGSAYELQTQVIIAHRLKLLNENVDLALDKIDEVQKMRYRLKQSLKKIVRHIVS